MFARVRSNTLHGIDAIDITVEVDVAKGIRAFSIVGLPDTAVRESIKRVASSIANSGFSFPRKKITVNLAPAGVRKQGSFFDLPIALGILASEDDVLREALKDRVICGELSLNGTLRPLIGTLSRAEEVRVSGLKDFILPAVNAAEANLVEGITPLPVRNLSETVAFLRGVTELEKPPDPAARNRTYDKMDADFADVKGQASAKRGLEVAAAGGHNVIMAGTPGAGKSMLANRFRTILPDMTAGEAIECTKIYSAAGRLSGNGFLIKDRPFRTVHHTISCVGLVGGGNPIMPGEISLAHHGVIFLDELPEFRRDALEALRQPLEEKRITIGRASGVVTYPADCVLVAAMNPCPCGNYSHPKKECHCTPPEIKRYLSKISGPLLDRFDIHLDVPPLDHQTLTRPDEAETSSRIRERINRAREIQLGRYGTFKKVNASLNGREISKFCRLEGEGEELLRLAILELGLSARAYDKVLKIARTIADLETKDVIEAHHVSEAISYRSLDRNFLASSL